MTPISYRVLIKDEIIESKTKGGLFLPDEMLDQEKTGAVYGTVISKGPKAFKARQVTYDKGAVLPTVDDFGGLEPNINQRVMFKRNAGMRFLKDNAGYRPINEDYKAEGESGLYRLINDEDIIAIMGE